MNDPTLSVMKDFLPVSYEQWREAVEQDLKGVPFEKKLVTQTYEDIAIQPIYTRRDWEGEADPSGFPGAPPFTRGGQPLGCALGGWVVLQEHGHPSPREANRFILSDLDRGVDSIELRLDSAFRAGLDPWAAGELAGRDGATTGSAADFAAVLEGVGPGRAGVVLEAGAQFVPAAAMLMAAWSSQKGAELRLAHGCLGADPMAVLAAEGSLPGPVDDSLALAADLAAWALRNAPGMKALRVDTSAYHHAGATAVQDLAISMATGVTYLRALTQRGMDLESACRQIVFTYSVGVNQFLAIAKLRAARVLWGRVVAACGGSPEAQAMTMHVQTSRRVLTVRDPWVNMLRATVGTFAAAVAGADWITVPPFDEALGLPTGFSRRIARNTQFILQEESGLSRVVDPAGGSWYVETLTDQVARAAWGVLQEIEREGGIAQALQSGWVAKAIDAAYAPRLKNIGRRKDAITGLSEFPNLGEKPVATEKIDRAALSSHTTKPEPSKAAQAAIERLAGAASGGDGKAGSIMNAAIEAAAAGATVSQMAKALAGGGEPISVAPLPMRPYGEPFEGLREASDAYLEKTGARPKVFLANMGPVAHHTARATYSRSFFEAGGFEVVTNDGFREAAQAAEAFAASGAALAVICSSDKLYPDLIPAVAPALNAAGAREVILAGNPGENRAAWQAAGVDRFIYIGCDVLETLRTLLQAQGVI